MIKKDLYEISTEISGISALVSGLYNQLDTDSDRLTIESFRTAMFGISNYLDRISDDLAGMK